MFEKIWNIIKEFFTNHVQHNWLENHLLYFFILGMTMFLVLVIIALIRFRKTIKNEEKERRKKDKQTLKFLSNKKNKSY
jgi:fucose permease